MGRALHHDYRRRCIYHITIKKHRSMPSFGSLAGSLQAPYISRSTLGQVIARNIAGIPSLNPFLRVMQYIIMPDHIHILLQVTDTIDLHLGNYVGMFKVKTTQDYGAVYKYIRDNPRRLAERRCHPEFFQRLDSLVINGQTYRAYGNLQLLDNPFKDQVVVHRADTSDQREENRQQWLHTAYNGGVLVSPFISPAEKAIREEAEAENGRFILITADPFPERYKPTGRIFELCSAGRVLMISDAAQIGAVAEHPSRRQCLALNSLAASVCRIFPPCGCTQLRS